MSKDFIRDLPEAAPHLKTQTWFEKIHIDGALLSALLALIIYGLIVLRSAGNPGLDFVIKQAINMLGALTLMVIVAQVEVRFWRRMAPWIYAGAIVLLILVLLVGSGAKGARRWLNVFGLVRFQPSELLKLGMPLMVAYYLSHQQLPPRIKQVAITAIIILIPTALIFLQPDLGTALLILASGFFVLLFAGLHWAWYVTGMASVGIIAPLMWFFAMHDYQKNRILTFLDPERDPLGTGWNIIQSKTAIGSGGFWGKGWFHGTQSHLDFLPEHHTDFIIAVLAEEFGFWGVLLLLLIYMTIVARGLYIAAQAPDIFARLLAATLSLTFFIYVFINMGMVSGLLPVVGVPLPLMSYGGTSAITILVSFGILMSISTHKKLIKR